VLAHRAWRHGLHGDHDAGVLRIGLPDAPSGSAGHGLAVRTEDPRAGDDPDLVRVLSVRGAPHVHRRADLPRVRSELRPRAPEDLRSWLGGHGPAFLASCVDPLAVLDQTVSLIHERFPGTPATKGELSAAISPELPAPARPWCAGCGTEHVIENLFRLATLLAGLELDRGDRRLVFRPPREPATDPPPDGSLLRAFAGYAGPIREGDAAAWLVSGALSGLPKPRGWAETFAELAPVQLGGAEYRMELTGFGDAPPPPPLVLLPPRDPYLLGNRAFLVPDREIAKQVWRPQVSPGVLVVDGEVAGTWRQRISGRSLYLHVTPFGKPRKGVRAAAGDQAELLAAVRGAGALHPDVVWEA
jgi:hypothetical protein